MPDNVMREQPGREKLQREIMEYNILGVSFYDARIIIDFLIHCLRCSQGYRMPAFPAASLAARGQGFPVRI